MSQQFYLTNDASEQVSIHLIEEAGKHKSARYGKAMRLGVPFAYWRAAGLPMDLSENTVVVRVGRQAIECTPITSGRFTTLPAT